MSCLYCNSVFHSSRKCDIYSTNDSRIAFVIRKGIGKSCSSPSECQSKRFNGKQPCVSCQFGRGGQPKCYVCFSDDHHSVFCEQRNHIEPFIPRIDQNLHARFFQTLDPMDKYSVAFSSPKYLHLLKQPKGITVTANASEQQIMEFEKDHLVISDFYFKSMPYNLPNLLATNAFSIKFIHLENIPNFSIKFLLQLLSPITSKLTLRNVQFDSAVKLPEILSKVPNIEKIELKYTNIERHNSWLDDLLKFNAGKNLKDLIIQLDNCNIDFGKLAKFMKTKMQTWLHIQLEIISIEHDPKDLLSTLQKKIGTHFVYGLSSYTTLLSISYPKCDRNIELSLPY